MYVFPRELRVGIIVRIFGFELARFARLRAAQILGEASERLFRAEVAHDVVRLHGIAAAGRRADQLDERVIAVLRGASLDRNERRGALAHLFERLLHLGVADLDLVHLHLDALVVAQLEFGQNFEDRAKAQRLAFLELDLVHLGARHRDELLLVERLLEVLRHERLHHLALDVLGETAAHQRHGRFAGPESGDAGDPGDVPRDFFRRFLDVLSRNFQLDFALAGCFSHEKVL